MIKQTSVQVAALTTSRKIGYASVETPISAVEMMLQLYLLEFYINDLGLDPFRASFVIAIAILWDAITDPIIGYFSDRSRVGRFGKRMQFLVPGAIGLALSTAFLFNPIHSLSQTSLMLWLFASYMALNTSMTLVAIPHIACVGDYAATDNERNVLLGWRMLFANMGLLLSILLPAVFAHDQQTSGNKGAAALVCALLILITTGMCLFSLNRVPLARNSLVATPSSIHLKNMLLGALQNRFFLPLLAAFVVAGIARSLNSSLALFYYKTSLGLDERTQVSVILLVFIVAITASIPFWIRLARSWDKKAAVLTGVFALGLLTMVSYPHFPRESITGPLIMAVLGGVSVGSILLIESLVVNAIDADAKKSGIRSDAGYFGIWKLFAKTSRALGIVLVGPLLVWTGYDEQLAQQSTQTADRISSIFGYGVGILFLISAIVFYFVPRK